MVNMVLHMVAECPTRLHLVNRAVECPLSLRLASSGATVMVVVIAAVTGLVVGVDVVAVMDIVEAMGIVAGRNLSFRIVDHDYN